MKMMNDMELNMVAAGSLPLSSSTLGSADSEYDAFEVAGEVLSGMGEAICEGVSILKYILFR